MYPFLFSQLARNQILADMLSPGFKQGGNGGTVTFDMPERSALPGPGSSCCKDDGCGSKILSPADSVFSQQDSVSSDECRNAVDHIPSPENGTNALLVRANEDGRGVDQVEGEEEVGEGEEREIEMVRGCGSPQNAFKISEFHKSLSDIAHSLSALLISEDEEDILRCAE